MVNATSAEIDGVGDLSAVNRRWAVEFLQGGGAEVDPVYTANLPNLVQTTGDQTVNGQKTFATPPILNNNPTLDSQIGNRLYNDGRYTRFDQSAIISANWTFQNPISGVDGVDPTDLVTKQQLDNATPTESDPIYASDSSRIAKTDLDTDFANGLRASGQDQFAWSGDLVANLQYLYDNYQSITEGGFAGEDLTGGQIVYQGANDQWFKADADVLAHVRGRLAFVTQGGTAGSWLPFTTIITVGGSGFTAGAPLYLSNTAGGYTETLPTTGYVRVIGASTSTTTRKIITEPINWINADGSEVNGVPVAGGGGGGDMTKAVYDTDSDNVVDDAEALNGFTDYPRLSTANTFTQDQTVQGTMDADYYNILTDRFIHNYWGNSENTAPNDWAGNTFVGLNSGNLTVGDGQSTGFLGGLNVGVGAYTLNALTTGIQNVMIGNESGALMTDSNRNIGIGDGVFYNSVTGVNDNVGIGKNNFQNLTTGEYNLGLGRNAGFYVGTGTTNMTSGDNHTLLGRDARASANATSNETVVGSQARGNGSNTVQLGDSNVTDFNVGATVVPAYWNDFSNDYTKIRPSNGFEVRYKVADAFGGGEELWKMSNNTSSATQSKGTLLHQGQNGESVGLFFESDSGGESGIEFWLGSDYLELNGARIEESKVDATTQNSTSNGNISESDFGEIQFHTTATAKTITIPDTLDEGRGAQISIVQQGAGAITVAVSGTATLNGVTAGSLTLTAQYSAVQLIQPVAGSDDWIAIGDFTMN